MLKNIIVIKNSIKHFMASKKLKKLKITLLFILKRKIYTQKNLNYILRCSLTLSVIVTSAVITSAFTKNNAQVVFLDNEPIGIIDNTDITENQFTSEVTKKLEKENGVKTTINGKLSLVPIIAPNSDISEEYSVLRSVVNDIPYEIDSYSISINGEKSVFLKSKSDAEKMLEQIKNTKTKGYKNIVSSSFVDDIKISEEYTDSNNINSYDEAYKILTGNISEKNIYTVVSGDTIEKIAEKTKTPLKEIFSLNEGITEDTILREGDKITTTKEIPLISIKTVLKSSRKEEIPYETEEIKNNSEYKTHKKVITEGSIGEKEITDEITYINGEETDRKIIGETITKEPVKEKIEIGTLESPPKKATGIFKMPIGGVLTSGFGSRWGTTHKGIDLGAPAGTPVHAADGGVVTFAGWNNGGYGYLVRISHENGLETYYAHNSRVAVSAGDRVYQGQVISYVGSTGDSTGNHLHFEVRDGGVAHNPFNYLK